MLFYEKYISDSMFCGPKQKGLTQLFICQSIRDRTAASLLSHKQEESLKIVIFLVPITKVGIGAYGASMVASNLNSVNGLMKQLKASCIFMRSVLSLAVRQASTKEESISVINTTVQQQKNYKNFNTLQTCSKLII